MDIWGIVSVSILLLLTYLGGLVLDKSGGPSLVGEVVVGALLGPHFFGLIDTRYTETLSLIGDMGLLLLVFEGGLTMDIQMLKTVGLKAFMVAFTGTLLPVVLGWLTMSSLGFEPVEAFAAGTALSATAIGFALRLLQDLDLASTPQGQLITAAAMIDDVLSLLVLAMLKAAHEEATAWHFLRPVAASLLLVLVGLMGRAAFISTLTIPTNIEWFVKQPMSVMLALMLIITLGFSYVADAIYSTTLLGTFMAGMICGSAPPLVSSWEKSPIPDHILPWVVRLFFTASVGFSIPVYALFHEDALLFGLVLTAVAFVAKFVSGAFAATKPKPWLSAAQVGCAMIGRGELGFMMASESLESGLMGDTAFSATIWALVLATLGGPILFKKVAEKAVQERLDHAHAHPSDLNILQHETSNTSRNSIDLTS